MDGPRGTAIALTFGLLADAGAKTAHGLMRGSDRFELLGLVDSAHAGCSPAVIFDPTVAELPIFATVKDALKALPHQPEFAIVGVAFPGGRLPERYVGEIAYLLESGVSIVSGLHQRLNEHPELVGARLAGGSKIYDIRCGRPWDQLRFWTGDIYSLAAPVIAVLGTDCALGKRTTARLLVEACRARGLNAEMIYTGQTGWMQGVRHGFIFDATLNDFVAGELEGAILACNQAQQPDVIFLEGQSALRNPTGPCGAEFLLSGNAKAVVLQAATGRAFFKGTEAFRCALPDVRDEIALIEQYGSKVLAVALNGEALSNAELDRQCSMLADELVIPVGLPLRSMDSIADAVVMYVRQYSGAAEARTLVAATNA